MLHSKQWHYSLHRDFQNCYSTRRSLTRFFSSNYNSNSTCRRQRALRVLLLHYRFQFPEILRIERQDLPEMHPCVLQDLPVTFQASSHKSLQRQTPVTPIAPETFQSFQTFQTFQSFQSFPDIPVVPDTPETFRTFQSFMIFQPFQAILQILHCSSISRDSTPFQHSPIRMHILQFLQILQFDWFPQKLHRVPVEQLQTLHYRHYILQRKGDVVISVKRASVKMSR